MPDPSLGLAAITAGTSLISSSKNASAAGDAADAQVAAAQAGIDENARQFDAVQALLAPFITGGTDAFSRMTDLAGVNGGAAQAAVYDDIQSGPQTQYALNAAQESLLAGQSATGGLRGGNTARAAAELGPAILSQMIDQNFSQLGGLAGMGQASAAGQAAAAQNLGNNNAALLGQQGSAIAGGALSQAAAFNQGLGGVANAAGAYLGSPAGAEMFSQWGF